jgi:hypothetical protein
MTSLPLEEQLVRELELQIRLLEFFQINLAGFG